MEFNEKLMKVLHHWVHHGEEHVASYLKWAKEARGKGMIDVAVLIEDAAESTREAIERFKEAEKVL